MSSKPVAGQKYLRTLALTNMDCKNNCDIKKGDEILQAFVGLTSVPGQPVYCKQCAFPNRSTIHHKPLASFDVECNYSARPSLDIYDREATFA